MLWNAQAFCRVRFQYIVCVGLPVVRSPSGNTIAGPLTLLTATGKRWICVCAIDTCRQHQWCIRPINTLINQRRRWVRKIEFVINWFGQGKVTNIKTFILSISLMPSHEQIRSVPCRNIKSLIGSFVSSENLSMALKRASKERDILDTTSPRLQNDPPSRLSWKMPELQTSALTWKLPLLKKSSI